MKIGTPLSASATTIMLLGAGERGKKIIIELQRLGVDLLIKGDQVYFSEVSPQPHDTELVTLT